MKKLKPYRRSYMYNHKNRITKLIYEFMNYINVQIHFMSN